MMDMFLRPLRKKLEKRMLELESRYGGLAFGFSGNAIFAVTAPAYWRATPSSGLGAACA